MWTALTSRPAKATKVPTTRAMLDSPSNGGVTSLRCSGAADGLPSISQANMKKISAKAGTMVPSPTPRLLSPAVVCHPLGHHEGGQPEPHQHDGAHVEPVAGQVRPTERGGQRGGAEGEQRGVEGDAVHEDEPGGLEAGAVAERLADPDEDAALVAGRQLGRDQPDGQQEQQRRDQVDRDGAEPEGRRVRQLRDAPHAGDHHHRQGRPRDQCRRRLPAPPRIGGAAPEASCLAICGLIS